MASARFYDTSGLTHATEGWSQRIRRMKQSSVMDWITGHEAPPRHVLDEAEVQREALLEELSAGSESSGSSLNLPDRPSGTYSADARWVHPPWRGYEEQETIWLSKFRFEYKPFDKISDYARSVCGRLLQAVDRQWRPDLLRHRQCWGVEAWPQHVSEGRPLTGDERQHEILTASAAPGVSRHHWGTDFDLFVDEVEPWNDAKALQGVYDWMIGREQARVLPRATTFGFIQPFTAVSGGYGPPYTRLRGYMEEKWHWSYAPVANAVLLFAAANEQQLDQHLKHRWSGMEFSFIAQYWRTYMFNVATSPPTHG